MKINLRTVWCIFFCCFIAFVIVVEVCHYLVRDKDVFRCRLHPSKDVIMEYIDAQVPQEKPSDVHAKQLYEVTADGTLPRISPDGEKVLDYYAAKSVEKNCLRVAVVLHGEQDLQKLMNKKEKKKITFIMPCNSEKLEEYARVLLENGHEFFLQLPTQQTVIASSAQHIAPFMANSNDTRQKLLQLLAMVRGAVGVANTNPTLLTKSSKDMREIASELSSRGLAFFDFLPKSTMLQKISQEEQLVYLTATNIFDQQVSREFKEGEAWLVSSDQVYDFFKRLPDKIVVGPITAGR